MYSGTEVSSETMGLLPTPSGYRMLIALPVVNEKTAGGIFLPGDVRKREETASVMGLVLKMGPDCYLDPDRFPNGKYCQEGDWVLIRSYVGTRFKLKDNPQEYRIINDDVVEGVIPDPSKLERAF